jgi:hypothetical protein
MVELLSRKNDTRKCILVTCQRNDRNVYWFITYTGKKKGVDAPDVDDIISYISEHKFETDYTTKYLDYKHYRGTLQLFVPQLRTSLVNDVPGSGSEQIRGIVFDG